MNIAEEKAMLQNSIAECKEVQQKIASIKGFGLLEAQNAIKIITSEREAMEKRLATIIKNES